MESKKKEVRKLFWHGIMQSVISFTLIVSLIGFYCTINPSFGWLANKDDASANGMSVSIKSSDDIVVYLHS